MEFLPDITKWTQALLRWGHVFFAILWVGTSFTFNYLDNKLPKNTKEDGIEADSILQHSGFYYKLIRYHGACLLYTSPSPRDLSTSRMPSSA